MTQNHHRDQDLSFLNQSLHNPLPINNTNNIHKNPIYHTKSLNQKSTNQIINILSSNKSTNKLQFNQEFQEYLARDQGNSNLSIVTFMGSKQIGKSFLIDFLISKQQKSPSRFLSKNGKMHVNIPTFEVRGKNGEKIIYFDTHDEISNECFLWTYFLSSIIVLNLAANDKKGQEQFISKLDNLHIHLTQEDLSLPQLIVLRRDTNDKHPNYHDFLTKIQSYALFSDVSSHHLAYPGTATITSKDIRDVAQNLLSQSFINDALNLSWQIKSTKPKTIQGNILGSKITGIILQPLTKSINKTGKIDSNKIWNDVIETLSVGYYNYYIKKYSQQLQNQFADQQPSDKYTLYKKLTKVKRVVNKKVQGFNSLSGDPTFQKYRDKLQQKIMNKQKIIKQINRQKSIKKNTQLSRHLFSQITPQNCEKILQKYCNSKFDDNKSEILLQNFQNVIDKKLKGLQKTQNSVKPSLQIKQLEEELSDIRQKVQHQRDLNSKMKPVDIKNIKSVITQRENEVNLLEAQLIKQRNISEEKKKTQSNQANQLETKIDSLKKTINQQEKQIDRLKKIKQSQAAVALQGLNKKLKYEEERYRALQQQVSRLNEKSKAMNIKTGKEPGKQSCCLLM